VAEPAALAAGQRETADSAATARSQETTSWQPDAVTSACTRATMTWGTDTAWVGVYRIVYKIDDAMLMISVIRIGHRADVYRS
jgi:hypothetical protein